MPYSRIHELPAGVRSSLPEKAQNIYLEAYNGAWDEYNDYEHGKREEAAHRLAWSAVKKKYELSGSGNWHKK